jgi:hypothetical protein
MAHDKSRRKYDKMMKDNREEGWKNDDRNDGSYLDTTMIPESRVNRQDG